MADRALEVGLVVPLVEEARQVFAVFPERGQEIVEGITLYDLESGVEGVKLVATVLGRMGPTPAVASAERLVTARRLDLLALVGLGGGLDDGLRLGDVVVASEVHEYLSAAQARPDGAGFALFTSGAHFAPHPEISRVLLDLEVGAAGSALLDRWRAACRSGHDRLTLPAGQAHDAPSLRQGRMASGDVVGAADAFADWLRKLDRKLAVIEMEAAGVARVADARLERRFLVLRGISDLANPAKHALDAQDGGVWRAHATRNAALLLKALLAWTPFQHLLRRHPAGPPRPAAAATPAPPVRDPGSHRANAPSVAVLALRSDLAPVQDAVVERLRRMQPQVGPVDAIDAARADAEARARAADLCLGFLGSRPSPALESLAQADRAARLAIPDLDLLEDEAEQLRFLRLRGRLKTAPSFEGPADAAEHAAERVAAWLRERSPAAPGHSAVLDATERGYLTVRLPAWRQGCVGPLVSRSRGQNLQRAELYVPLEATTDLVFRDDEERIRIQAGARPADLARASQESKSAVSLERALSLSELPHLVLEGEPGSGKTVLLQHVAYVLAQRHLAQPLDAHELGLAQLAEGRPLLPLPVFLEARALAAHLAEEDGVGGLLAALAAELGAAAGDAPPRSDVTAALEAGRYLLLVDSLDEVPSLAGRQAVLRCLEGGARLHPATRLVLTTRPSAYTGRLHFGRALRRLRIAPLGARQVDALSAQWCRANAGGDDGYLSDLRDAIVELQRRQGEARLTENPLLLTSVFLVYAQRRRLPNSPAALYLKIVEILCETREGDPASETRRQVLEQIARILQDAGGTELAVAILAERLLEVRAELETVDAAVRLIDWLGEATGLLRFERRESPQGAPQATVRPWHRSFQEYLCACQLAAGSEGVDAVTRRLCDAGQTLDPAWEGVLRFLVGVQGQRGSKRALAHVQTLYELARGAGDTFAHPRVGRLLGLVASGLSEYGEFFPDHALLKEVPRRVVETLARDGAAWPLADRLLALEAIGRLGDPRLGLDDLWVGVAGRRMRLGETGAEREVAGFAIAWRPTTVADFRSFVEDPAGYRDARWWTDGEAPDGQAPPRWGRQRHRLNCPVTDVSWFAARAFCRWASAHWPGLAGGEVRLPSEFEWELAATGGDGRRYPWGKEEPGEGDAARCNYGSVFGVDGAPGTVTPVGAYPNGSRNRLVDLAGNVWEWCDDTFAGAERVIRGGCWYYSAEVCRAAYRSGRHPAFRDAVVGFRVLLAPGSASRRAGGGAASAGEA